MRKHLITTILALAGLTHNGVQEWHGVLKDSYIVVVPADRNGEGAEYGVVCDRKP
ncbi:hypothetical protein [Burkholderia vietnamiensis]|uniref:hypothetical protein n=1 Tax=Burkholderia vietnamiensis TaxID=60552 RepID=UPI001CF21E22|nr:hypothetical protein [Burkholderia vietnamiensis]MCA8180679.1 hypothetical protein [Burkholderia vietnamiensis]